MFLLVRINRCLEGALEHLTWRAELIGETLILSMVWRVCHLGAWDEWRGAWRCGCLQRELSVIIHEIFLYSFNEI